MCGCLGFAAPDGRFTSSSSAWDVDVRRRALAAAGVRSLCLLYAQSLEPRKVHIKTHIQRDETRLYGDLSKLGYPNRMILYLLKRPWGYSKILASSQRKYTLSSHILRILNFTYLEVWTYGPLEREVSGISTWREATCGGFSLKHT